MKRKIYADLVDWKKIGPAERLYWLTGPAGLQELYRQTVRQGGIQDVYSHWSQPSGDDIKDLFAHYLNDLNTLFMYLSGYYNIKLYQHQSLIIFDEVQLCPKARAAIKYLVADGRYNYMETDSLISAAIYDTAAVIYDKYI